MVPSNWNRFQKLMSEVDQPIKLDALWGWLKDQPVPVDLPAIGDAFANATTLDSPARPSETAYINLILQRNPFTLENQITTLQTTNAVLLTERDARINTLENQVVTLQTTNDVLQTERDAQAQQIAQLNAKVQDFETLVSLIKKWVKIS